MASSPLPEVDEGVGDALDLWESASLDYPGRNIDSPHGWEFMEEQQISFEEPRYHNWHLVLGNGFYSAYLLTNSINMVLPMMNLQ